jgi:glycosyltransferase involved in cell wall biosynthesis
MTPLKLSVVLCTCSGAAYLGPQLDSLLAQSRLPDEIVVGDDASSDDTPTLLRAFAARCRSRDVVCRLILRPDNLGFVRNFSDTLREATGDVVFLCDQDDVWRVDKLATMARRFEDDPDLALLCSDAQLVDARGVRKGTTLFEALELRDAERQSVHEGRAFDILLRRSIVTGATAALRREAAVAVLPVGEGWIHDEWLAIMLASTGKLGMIEDQLIDYRQHGANQVGMHKRTLRDKWRDMVCPRAGQFRNEIMRMAALEAAIATRRLETDGVVRRRRHFEVRLQLGQLARWRRLPAILREWCAGNYARFGTGPRSALRDVLRRD